MSQRGLIGSPPNDETMLHRLAEVRRKMLRLANASDRTVPTASKQAAQENAAVIAWAIKRIEDQA